MGWPSVSSQTAPGLKVAPRADAPLAKARVLVTLGAVAFSVSRQGAESAGRLTLQALQPLAALHATPGTGLAWNTSALATSGTLSVVTAINASPTKLTSSVSGSELTLSWPADHTGWVLQGQTNAPGKGLGTNWVTVSGSSTTNSATMNINPATGSVFYRLVYP